MTLNQLIYFCKLAEKRHYGQAAKELLIAQPSLSKSIALLENELEVALFERRGRSIQLTRAGEAFYARVKPTLAQLDAAREAMRHFSANLKLPVIGCVSPAITSVVVPLMNAYRTQVRGFPKVTMRVDTSEALVEALRRDECDIALCTRIPKAVDVTFVPMLTQHFVVVMREDDPLARFEAIRPEQLRDRPMAFTNAETYNSIVMGIFERHHVVPLIHSYANDDSALFGMVRAGSAIFITSDYPQVYNWGLAVRRLDQHVCMRVICLAYTDRSLLNPEIRELIDFAKGYCHNL